MSDSESSSDSGDTGAAGYSSAPSFSSVSASFGSGGQNYTGETVSYATDGEAAKPPTSSPHPSSNSGLSLSAGLGGIKEAAAGVGTALTLKGLAAASPVGMALVAGYGLYKAFENYTPDGTYTPPASSSSHTNYNTTSGLFNKPAVSVPVEKAVTVSPAVASAVENMGDVPRETKTVIQQAQTSAPVSDEKPDYSFLLPLIGLFALGGFYGA